MKQDTEKMGDGINKSYMSTLFDWKGFELFVADLYKDSVDLIVKHDVTEIGKSGVKRQVDVLVLQKTKFHTIKILNYYFFQKHYFSVNWLFSNYLL